MNLYKYDGEVKKSVSNSSSSSNSNSSSSTSTGSASGNLWGNNWSGGDLDSSIYTNGNIFIYGSDGDEEEYDEDEDSRGTEFTEPNTRVPRDEDDEYDGCLFADDGLFAQRAEFKDYCYANEQYVNYPDKNGVKTNILDLFKQIVPVGSIIMHNGQTSKDELLSYGWAICDGTNGTPNLKDKFIKGVTATANVGTTGGTNSQTLTVSNMPSHNHSINLSITSGEQNIDENVKDKLIPILDKVEEHVFDDGGSSNYCLYSGYKAGDNGLTSVSVQEMVNMSGGVEGEASIGYTGNGTSFDNQPSFYSLIYIMRVK